MTGGARDLALHRLAKAKERLDAARLLFENGSYADSVNRSYYAAFTAARALLSLKSLDSKKHSGIISLFNQNFVKTGIIGKNASRILITSRSFREDADYADYVEITEETARMEIEKVDELVTEITKKVAELTAHNKD